MTIQRWRNCSVKLTRINDKKTWEFGGHKLADGYFNIDTANYGDTLFTIIFQPTDIGKYNKGDKYQVEVSGIHLETGGVTNIQFETIFFDLVK